MSDLRIAAELAEVDEKCIPEHGLTVVQFIDPDGAPSFLWTIHGEPRIQETLGLLTTLEHALVDMLQHPDNYEESS